MSVADTYVEIKSEDKQVLFTELIELKKKKKDIEDKIKELEAMYKPMVQANDKDLFFSLPNGYRFSIKKSIRTGSINAKALEKDGINVDKYRGKPSEVWTFRLDA